MQYTECRYACAVIRVLHQWNGSPWTRAYYGENEVARSKSSLVWQNLVKGALLGM